MYTYLFILFNYVCTVKKIFGDAVLFAPLIEPSCSTN